jgi:hypothetical protein
MKKLIRLILLMVVVFAPLTTFSAFPAYPPSEETRWFNIENVTVNIPGDLPTDSFEVRSATSSPHLLLRHT